MAARVGRQTPREQRNQQPGQHVAGAGRGEGGRSGRVRPGRPGRGRDDGPVALEQHHHPQPRASSRAASTRSAPDRLAGKPGELPIVRRHHRRRRPVAQRGRQRSALEQRQRVSIEDRRHGRTRTARSSSRARSSVPIPSRTTTPVPGRFRRPGDDHHRRVCPEDIRRARARVPDHPAGPASAPATDSRAAPGKSGSPWRGRPHHGCTCPRRRPGRATSPRCPRDRAPQRRGRVRPRQSDVE